MGQRTGPEDDSFMAHFGSWITGGVLAVIALGISWLMGSCVG